MAADLVIAPERPSRPRLLGSPAAGRIDRVWSPPLVEIETPSRQGFRMSSVTRAVATLDDLARVEGKAELIAGRIVHLMPTGRKPSRVASRIFRSLDDFAAATGQG